MASIYVKQYPGHILIENPGGFLDGITENNIITHASSPRNKLIAETLQRLKYVQRTGQGVDIIYNPYETMFMKLMKKHGKPAYNGLKMLLYQGVAAYELWNDCKISSDMADIIYEDMKKELGISE